MVTPVIPISSDSFEESVGSHVPREILFGTIPTISVISPSRVLDLVDYSSSFDSDPLEDSLLVAPELPLVSPFLCSDDSEANSESEPAEQRPERHESLTPSYEFPFAPVVSLPERVRPFLARRLAWRRVSHCYLDRHSSPDFTSDSTSSGSSSDSSSDISSVHLHIHYQNHHQFILQDAMHQSSLDSSSERSLDLSSPFVGPSRKRCRSHTTLAKGEEHMKIGTIDAETVADLGASDGVRAPTEDGICMGVKVATSDIREDEEEFESEASARGAMEITVDPLTTSGISESTRGDAFDLEGTLYDIAHYMLEVPLDRITEFETAQRQLEAGQLEIRSERDDHQRRLRRTMANTRSRMTPVAIKEMINRHVIEALETREANKNIRLGNGNDKGGNRNGNGNENRGGNGNKNHNENNRDARPVIRECTYQDSMKCQPLNFKGTKKLSG
uniref:Reverse transcriptase domain-containing protein n=1 Tax=Tanacetum cinerariifolium TaxID=118510 RepID=A0A699HTJ0_TANCI|nr:hypothetical protein [Tanacetum cinerariifolium]